MLISKLILEVNSILTCTDHSPHEHRFHRRLRRFRRRMFLTKEEMEELHETKIQRIEQYREFLQKELTGVNEYLAEATKEQPT